MAWRGIIYSTLSGLVACAYILGYPVALFEKLDMDFPWTDVALRGENSVIFII